MSWPIDSNTSARVKDYLELPLLADPPAKRGFDISLAFLATLVTAPLWLLIWFLIWLEDGRPALLRQERVGLGGEGFKVFKFRTMRRHSQHFRVIEDCENDPRVTKVGKVLRATAMDELPQLLNIIIGNMSFVGPRALPLQVEDHEKVLYKTIEDVGGYELRSMVRPGLTGIGQVFAAKDISRRNKFRYDRFYIKKWTFGLDVKLILMSIWVSVRGKWETRRWKI